MRHHTHNKGQSRRAQHQRSPAQTQYAKACQNASGSHTLQGMSQLGPINSFSDLLLQSGATPQQTLAAEQLVHLIEGWRYAASATSAVLSHASGQAVHFAYYAELRAAMSLFAWSGIRVKMNDYFYLDSSGIKQKISGQQKTHPAVWGLWNEWVKRQDSQQLFNSITLFPSISMSDVIRSLRYVDTSKTLKHWGLDLIGVDQDHSARNTASYNAMLAHQPLLPMLQTDVDLVLALWKLFLSNGSSLTFDAALISYIIDDAIPKIAHQSCTRPSDSVIINSIADEISSNTGVEKSLIIQKITPSQYSFIPFQAAAESKTNAKNILCRAFFLLRIAMLAVKQSIDSLPTPNSPSLWIKNWLSNIGVWDPKSGIELVDIQEDYSLSVELLSPSPLYPDLISNSTNAEYYARLTRPDACVAWGLIA